MLELTLKLHAVEVISGAVPVLLRDSGVAEVDGVAEPGAEGLAEGAEDAGGGCGALGGEAIEMSEAVDGDLREDAEGDGGVGWCFTGQGRSGGWVGGAVSVRGFGGGVQIAALVLCVV